MENILGVYDMIDYASKHRALRLWHLSLGCGVFPLLLAVQHLWCHCWHLRGLKYKHEAHQVLGKI